MGLSMGFGVGVNVGLTVRLAVRLTIGLAIRPSRAMILASRRASRSQFTDMVNRATSRRRKRARVNNADLAFKNSIIEVRRRRPAFRVSFLIAASALCKPFHVQTGAEEHRHVGTTRLRADNNRVDAVRVLGSQSADRGIFVMGIMRARGSQRSLSKRHIVVDRNAAVVADIELT